MIVNIYDVNHGFCGYVRDGFNWSQYSDRLRV